MKMAREKLTKSDEAMAETLRKAKETLDALCCYIENERYSRLGLRAFMEGLMGKTPGELAGVVDRLVADAKKNDSAHLHYLYLLEQGETSDGTYEEFGFKAYFGDWLAEHWRK